MTLKTIKWSVRPPNFDGERSEMLIRVFVVSRSSSVLVRSSVKTGGFVPNSFEHLCRERKLARRNICVTVKWYINFERGMFFFGTYANFGSSQLFIQA